MAKDKPTNETLGVINAAIDSISDPARGQRRSQNYRTSYTLTESEQQFAVANEVARSMGCSINEATEKFSITNTVLPSVGSKDFTTTAPEDIAAFAMKNTKPDKPTVVMVNYSIGGPTAANPNIA